MCDVTEYAQWNIAWNRWTFIGYDTHTYQTLLRPMFCRHAKRRAESSKSTRHSTIHFRQIYYQTTNQQQ